MGKLKNMQVTFNAKVVPIKPVNQEFELCKIYVQGVGKNRNGSYMSKENIEKYSPTLNYCPVVGHLIEATDDEGNKHQFMGGHDWKITENWEVKDLTVPYGVVVENSFDYEIINEYGVDVEYMTAQVILWTGRYPELKEAIYKTDFYFNQSMELNPIQYRDLEEDSNYIEILEWSYSALCLLGKADDKDSPEHTEPCFINSKVVPIEFSKSEFSEAMDEMKEKLSFCFEKQSSTTMEVDIDSKQIGGNILDKKNVILEKYNKTIEDLDFSIDDLSEEEFEIKMEELFGEKKQEPVAFSTTYNQRRKALSNALDPIIVKDKDGNYVEETYFYISDFDDSYVFVEVSHWTKDDYTNKYGKYNYTFDKSTLTATISKDFEEMVMEWLTLDEKTTVDELRANYETKYSTIEQEFSTYKAEHSFLNSDFDALKEYKVAKEAAERKSDEESLLSGFEELIGETPEFSKLKKDASTYSLDDLKKECLCVVGFYAATNKKDTTKQEGAIKFSLEKTGKFESDPYGGLMDKYLNKESEDK